jgi:nucleoside-diphosphate-sugar epimerase
LNKADLGEKLVKAFMNTPGNHDPAPGISSVLVTGGTGFVGAYIIRDLVKSGYKVKALRRNMNVPLFIDPAVMDKVEWFHCDVLDILGLYEAMQDIDAVIHSAAIVSFDSADRETLLSTNIEGTANVVNAALDSKISRFIYVSSVAAIGKSLKGEVIRESTKWQENKYTTAYALSKHHAEMHVWRAIAEGLNAVIVNPSTVLGYGDWNASSSRLFKNAYEGFRWFPGGSTGFVDVEDVSAAILRLLTTNIHSERFILNADTWSYKKLFDTIAEAFGKKGPSMKATKLMAAMAWRLEKVLSLVTRKKPLLSRETALISQTNNVYDNSKILAALPGFAFRRLDETIVRACEQYKNQNRLM